MTRHQFLKIQYNILCAIVYEQSGFYFLYTKTTRKNFLKYFWPIVFFLFFLHAIANCILSCIMRSTVIITQVKNINSFLIFSSGVSFFSAFRDFLTFDYNVWKCAVSSPVGQIHFRFTHLPVFNQLHSFPNPPHKTLSKPYNTTHTISSQVSWFVMHVV